MLSKNCLQCEKVFYFRAYRLEKAKYCSRDCKKTHLATPFIVCQQCNATFKQGRGAKNQKFCSIKCKFTAWQVGTEKSCLHCAKIYTKPLSQIEKSRFCSRKCQYEFKPQEKVCKKCDKTLPFNCFGRQKAVCKSCTRIATFEKSAISPEDLRLKIKNYETATQRAAHLKENPSAKWCYKGKHFVEKKVFGSSAACSECKRSEYKTNAVKVSIAGEIYRKNNKEKLIQRQKLAYQNNKDYYKTLARNRRAKVRQAQGSFTLKQWQAKLEYFGNRCYLCNKSLEGKQVHAEHRTPISRGGSNFIANIAPACANCNLSKHDKTEREFREFKANR